MYKEPLFLTSEFHEKIWGGDHLKSFGYQLPSDKIGEYWAISGHPHGRSTVNNGEYAGKSLAELWQTNRELFANVEGDSFPLLTKILDANDWLSVQVHPDDTYAQVHEGERGKTECWYVISATPDAEIIYGHNAKTREELAAMIEAKKWDKLLRKIHVKAGDFYYVPSGTMHAIGAGCMMLETQQSSDTTYRVYDFDRPDKDGKLRELHIPQSIDVLTIPGDKVPANTPVVNKFDGATISTLLQAEFFDVYKWEITEAHTFTKFAPYTLVSILEGKGKLTIGEKEYPLEKGEHFILPADVAEWTISGQLMAIASNAAPERK